MNNAYDELPLHLETDEDTSIDLWVTFTDSVHPAIVLKEVTSAVRYRGWWTIEYVMSTQQKAIAYLDAATIRMFSAVTHTEPQGTPATQASQD